MSNTLAHDGISHQPCDSTTSTAPTGLPSTNDRTGGPDHAKHQFPVEDYHRTTTQPSTGHTLLSAWWSLELGSISISVGLFAAYWWLLATYSDQPVSQWHGLQVSLSPFKNLPSAAAFVMTAFRIFLTYPITAAMGQLKWHHLGQPSPRPVASLQAFDAASRGTFGSARLLLSKGAFHSMHISLGCILILSSQGLQTLSQSAITQHGGMYLQPEIPGILNASIAFGRRFNVSENNYFDRNDVNITDRQRINADSRTQAALLTSWAYYLSPKPTSQRLTSIPANCSRETCEWENLTTIAIAYDCKSTPVTIDPEGFGYSNEANITSGVPSSNMSLAHAQIHLKPSLVVPNNSNFAATDSNSPSLIIHLAAIAEQDNGSFEAAECVLNWVVATWTHTTYNSTRRSLLQSGVEQYPNVSTTPTNDSGNDIVINAPCNAGYNITTKEDPGGKACQYTIADHAHIGLRNFLFRTFRGSTARETSKPHNLLLSNDTIFNLFRSSWQANSRQPNITNPLNQTLDIYTWNIGKGIGDTVRGLSDDMLSGKVRKEE
ncbi:hypothetical protein CCHR01_03884 [Colletotrichum chrysophilum]|uniref:Uncharacterized protein n=1 Tax=Colletotrichum chrysophilum TaxID=1836956 RepID=A0AAD9EN37_9PEZI|nr:hypothetical protein CCHR01_03884 [Colletotrichum chrysophilum]